MGKEGKAARYEFFSILEEERQQLFREWRETGDVSTFRVLYEDLMSVATKVARKFVSRSMTLEAIMDNAQISEVVYKLMCQFDPEKGVLGKNVAIKVRFVIIDYIRIKKWQILTGARQLNYTDEDGTDSPTLLHSTNNTVEDSLDRDDDTRYHLSLILAGAAVSLTEGQRRTFRAVYGREAQSQATLAKEIGVTEAAISLQLDAAREAIKRTLRSATLSGTNIKPVDILLKKLLPGLFHRCKDKGQMLQKLESAGIKFMPDGIDLTAAHDNKFNVTIFELDEGFTSGYSLLRERQDAKEVTDLFQGKCIDPDLCVGSEKPSKRSTLAMIRSKKNMEKMKKQFSLRLDDDGKWKIAISMSNSSTPWCELDDGTLAGGERLLTMLGLKQGKEFRISDVKRLFRAILGEDLDFVRVKKKNPALSERLNNREILNQLRLKRNEETWASCGIDFASRRWDFTMSREVFGEIKFNIKGKPVRIKTILANLGLSIAPQHIQTLSKQVFPDIIFTYKKSTEHANGHHLKEVCDESLTIATLKTPENKRELKRYLSRDYRGKFYFKTKLSSLLSCKLDIHGGKLKLAQILAKYFDRFANFSDAQWLYEQIFECESDTFVRDEEKKMPKHVIGEMQRDTNKAKLLSVGQVCAGSLTTHLKLADLLPLSFSIYGKDKNIRGILRILGLDRKPNDIAELYRQVFINDQVSAAAA